MVSQLNDIRADIATELHRPARRNYDRRHVTVRGFRDLFQADLVEMIPYADKNDNYRYLLTIIDVFSKYAWARPLKTKSAACVTHAMRDILNSADGRIFKPPRFLQTDLGKEFYNATFKNMLKEFKISLYSVYSIKKVSVVERFNRTLKTKMWRKFSALGTYRWINLLDDLLAEYNTSKHRTIQMKPADITLQDEKKILKLHKSNHNNKTRCNVKFKVGDCVRISRLKGTFEKGYTANWSSELFVVTKVEPTFPVTYKLRDYHGRSIQGGFYTEELQKVKHSDIYLVEKIIRKRVGKVLVKWFGFPSSENSWEDEKNVILP